MPNFDRLIDLARSAVNRRSFVAAVAFKASRVVAVKTNNDRTRCLRRTCTSAHAEMNLVAYMRVFALPPFNCDVFVVRFHDGVVRNAEPCFFCCCILRDLFRRVFYVGEGGSITRATLRNKYVSRAAKSLLFKS